MTLSDRLSTLESTGLIRLALLEPDLEYLFRHALVQDAAYTSILVKDQKQLHLAVGAAVENLYSDQLEAYAAMLALHFEKGGDDRKALKYFILAGEASLASYANQEAERQFRSALAISWERHCTDKATSQMPCRSGRKASPCISPWEMSMVSPNCMLVQPILPGLVATHQGV